MVESSEISSKAPGFKNYTFLDNSYSSGWTLMRRLEGDRHVEIGGMTGTRTTITAGGAFKRTDLTLSSVLVKLHWYVIQCPEISSSDINKILRLTIRVHHRYITANRRARYCQWGKVRERTSGSTHHVRRRRGRNIRKKSKRLRL